MSERGPRKSVTLGDVLIKTDKATGQYEQDANGVPKEYYLKCYVPDDVDEAGIGEPNIIIKRDDYLNLRLPTEDEVKDMPDWKKPIAQLRCWKSLIKK